MPEKSAASPENGYSWLLPDRTRTAPHGNENSLGDTGETRTEPHPATRNRALTSTTSTKGFGSVGSPSGNLLASVLDLWDTASGLRGPVSGGARKSMPAKKSLRRSPLKRSRWGKPQTISQIERDLEAKLALGFWQETVRRPCRNCGAIHNLEAHHVIAKSVLKRELASKGKPCPVGFLWDPRNGMSLCRDCHERFTNRALQVCVTKLSAASFEFAHDHGLTWRLFRDYPNLTFPEGHPMRNDTDREAA